MPRLTRLPLLLVLFLPMPFAGCLSGPLRGADPSAARLADSADSSHRTPPAPNSR